jgi:hypothetical protein
MKTFLPLRSGVGTGALALLIPLAAELNWLLTAKLKVQQRVNIRTGSKR